MKITNNVTLVYNFKKSGLLLFTCIVFCVRPVGNFGADCICELDGNRSSGLVNLSDV